MTTLNIWFNQTYSTHFHTVRAVKESSQAAGINTVIHTTSDNPLSPVLQAGDVSALEPARSTMGGEDYIEWALKKVAADRIDVLIPMRETMLISAHRADFAALGCTVIADTPETIALLEDKERAYLHAEQIGVPTPPWRVVSTSTQFRDEYANLSDELVETFGEPLTICIKPVDGVGGTGFKRILRPDAHQDFPSIITGYGDAVRYTDLVDAIDRAGDLGGRFMLMPWLDNPEVSVDTLALDGDVKIVVPRAKDNRVKTIGGPNTVKSVEMARKIVSSLNMSHLSNTQTRVLRGEPVYLETNARMSGGIPVSGLLGVDMCWEAIRSALRGTSLDFTVPVEPVHYTMAAQPALASYWNGGLL